MCRPTDIQLSINVCPVYFANFLPNELALNGKHNLTQCLGLMVNSTDPPVLQFSLQLDDSSANTCGNFIEVSTNIIKRSIGLLIPLSFQDNAQFKIYIFFYSNVVELSLFAPDHCDLMMLCYLCLYIGLQENLVHYHES